MTTELTTQQIRQRRRFLKSSHEEEAKNQQIKMAVKQWNSPGNMYFLKLYLVISAALICTVAAVVTHYKPDLIPTLLGKKTMKEKPFKIASVFPPNIILNRDLPRFFRSYSIATQDNQAARIAASRSAKTRIALRKVPGSNFKVYFRTYDDYAVRHLLEGRGCGHQFNPVYDSSSDERKSDLIMWCLLGTNAVEGFLQNSVQIVKSPLSMTKGRGIVVRPSSNPDKALSSLFYLHPRNLTQKEPIINRIASRVLTWILSHPETDAANYDEYREMMQAYIHELVHSEGEEENYIFLDEVCQPYRPPRTVAENCEGEICCYFVLPDTHYSILFEESSSSDE